MKLVVAAVIVLFGAATALFLTSGLEAYRAGLRARERLVATTEAAAASLTDADVVGHAEARALGERSESLAALVEERLTALVDLPGAEPPPALETVLGRADVLARLAPPLTVDQLTRRADDPALAAAFARLLRLALESSVASVERLEVRDGPDREAVPEIEVRTLELAVTGSADDLLRFLEAIVPGRGYPALSVASAALRRIDPSLWSAEPATDEPPLRLSLTIEVLTRRDGRGER